MSSKLFMLESGNLSAATTASMPKIATGTGLRCLLQIAPTMGIEIVEWGVSFDGSAAATPGQVDLVEVDVPATGGTSSNIPASYLSASLSAAGATNLQLGASLQATATNFQVGVQTFGGYGIVGPPLTTPVQEQMQVTGGGATTSLSVLRGINDTTAVTSAPVGALVYALPGTGVYSDIQPYSSQGAADPTYAVVANIVGGSATGAASATGFSFQLYNTPTRVRQGDMQLLPPTAPYVKQFPLERGFEINPGRYGQIRCTFGTSTNAYAYVIFQA